MNAPDGSTQDELATRLDRLATTIDLRAGSLDAVRRRADERTRRRRTTIASLSVVAVVGASLAGIVVLSRPTDPTVTNRAADDVPPASDLDPSTSPEGADTSVTATNAEPVAETAGTLAATAPLEVVDSDLTWTTVRPDSTQALAYPYMYPASAAGDGPIYMYSTAPGRDPDGEQIAPTLYRSDDGISWTVVDRSDVPEHTQLVGPVGGTSEAIYALSTAPSTAASDPPSSGDVVTVDTGGVAVGSGADVVLSVRDADGAWTSTVVPLDTAAWLDEPGVRHATPTNLSASSTARDGSGSILVLASTWLDLDVAALDVDQNLDNVQILPSGVEVTRYDPACMATATTITSGAGAVADPVATVAASGATTEAPTEAATDTTAGAVVATSVDPAPTSTVTGSAVGAPDECDAPTIEHHDLSELGVSQRALDEYFGPPHLFASTDDGAFTEVAFPGSVPAEHVISGPRLIALGHTHALVYDELTRADYSLIASHLWLSTDGQQWEERVLPPAVQGAYGVLTLGLLADGRLAGVASQAVEPWHPLAFVEDGNGGWHVTDLAGALRPEDGVSATLGASAATVGDTGITLAAIVMTDRFVEQGPVSTTDGDVTISLVDSMGTYVVTSTATGEEIARTDPRVADPSRIRYEETGDAVLLDPTSGEEIARISWEVQQRLSDLAYGSQASPTALLLHSTDGVSWSRESVQELGSPTAGWVNGLASIDGRVLASYVDPGVRNDDGSPATFVLVGTPTQ